MGETATTFLTFLGSLVTECLKWMGEVLQFIIDEPVILVPTLVFFVVGGVIGLVTRILRG